MNASAGNRRKRLLNRIGREFARASDQASIALMRGEGYGNYVRRVRALERAYLARLENHPKMALEIRRRTAEGLLTAAHECGLSLSVCRRRLRALDELGYQDLRSKALFRLIFARIAISRGRPEIALQTLTALLPSLQSSVNRRKTHIGKQNLQLTKSLIADLTADL